MCLADALLDLKNEAIKGQQITAELIVDVASDYGLNPILVRRKFDESYPNPELLAATAAATDPIAAAAREREQLIERYLKLYGVDRGTLRDVWYTGLDGTKRYTVIGRVDRDRLLAVRFSDASGWRIPARDCRPA